MARTRQQVVPIAPLTSEAILKLAREWTLPVKTLLLAVHCKALAVLSGRREILSAVVVSGRPELTGAEQMLGLFINTVPLRQSVAGRTWRQLAESLLAEELADFPHRRFPFATMVEQSANQAMESLFYFTNYYIYQAMKGRAEIDVKVAYAHEVASFPLAANFAIEPFEGRVVLNIACQPDLFTEEQIDATLRVYQNALQALATYPEALLDDLCLLDVPALDRLAALGRNDAEGTTGVSVSLRIAKRTAENPDRIALIWRQQRFSYQDLEREVSAMASRIASFEVKRGDLLAFMLKRSPRVVILMLACLRRGICFLPLDSETPAGRLERTLATASPKLLVLDVFTRDRGAAANCAVVALADDEPLLGVPEPQEADAQPGSIQPGLPDIHLGHRRGAKRSLN